MEIIHLSRPLHLCRPSGSIRCFYASRVDTMQGSKDLLNTSGLLEAKGASLASK